MTQRGRKPNPAVWFEYKGWSYKKEYGKYSFLYARKGKAAIHYSRTTKAGIENLIDKLKKEKETAS
jgi:hypothetical protein